MVNSKDFSKRLERIMDFYDLTASAFADTIDVGRSSISHILSGRNKPSLDFVMKIIDSFPEVELYWLLNGKGNFPKQTITPVKESATRKDPDLFDTPSEEAERNSLPEHKPNAVEQVINNAEKEISRIVIFYKDGTFQNFVED